MANADFSSEALLLAELAYPDHRAFETKVHEDTNTTPTQGASDVAHTERSAKRRTLGKIQEIVPGTWDYGTARWALRNIGWLGASKVMGSYMGGPLKSTQSSLTEDSSSETKSAMNNNEDEKEVITEGNKATPSVDVARSSVAEQHGDSLNPVTMVPDWQPRCPHCGRPNEYGHSMCDPVLPRICQDAST